MKSLHEFILETSNTKNKTYNYHPKTKEELSKLLKEKISMDCNADLNDIDVSAITDMSWLFDQIRDSFNCEPRDINISEWDVSNVTNMRGMFNECRYFNCDLSKWDVSNVTDMTHMFDLCKRFDADLSKWDVSNVIKHDWMFVATKCKKKPKFKK